MPLRLFLEMRRDRPPGEKDIRLLRCGSRATAIYLLYHSTFTAYGNNSNLPYEQERARHEPPTCCAMRHARADGLLSSIAVVDYLTCSYTLQAFYLSNSTYSICVLGYCTKVLLLEYGIRRT